jgi:hypothetical protein
VGIVHWRLLEDGRVVIVTVQEPFDDLKAPIEEAIRGEINACYLLEKTEKGTLVKFVITVSEQEAALLVTMFR